MSVILAGMEARDLPQAASLGRQLGYDCAEIESRFAAISKNPEEQLFVARDAGGTVLGWIQVNRERDSLLAGPRAEVTALVVDERSRGRGIGRALLEQAEAWARERRLPALRVRSNVVRREAHAFYLKRGYALSKSSHVFTKAL